MKGPKRTWYGYKPLQWFMDLEGHEHQRNTERRIVAASLGHLSEAYTTQDSVVAALFDGQHYAVDGHTRRAMWLAELLAAPSEVFVQLFECRTKQEFVRLYMAFDNKGAAEDSRDLAYGRMRALGMGAISSKLENSIVQAARVLYHFHTGGRNCRRNDISHIKNLCTWLPAIKHYNDRASIPNVRKRMHSSLLAAELFTIQRDGADTSDLFWDKVHADAGEKPGKKFDAVETLNRIFRDRKRHGTAKGGNRGSYNTNDLFALGLYLYDQYRVGRQYVSTNIQPGATYAYHAVQMVMGRLEVPPPKSGKKVVPPKHPLPKAKTVRQPWLDDKFDDDEEFAV